jgi:threonine dehydrogenase-like Zn-dependent dehydrogenase
MRALYFDNELTLKEDYPDPRPNENEAMIHVRMAGICNTDLEILRGYMGFRGIPGHEFVGTVVGGAEPNLIGERVVGEINAPCGDCDLCRRGLNGHCLNRSVLGILGRDGAFAEYMKLPVDNLYRVPDSLSDERAVFTEPVAAAFEILEQIHPEEGTPVLILGDGKLGLLIAMVLAASQLDVYIHGHHPGRIERVVGSMARYLTEEEAAAQKFPLVVEATGRPVGFTTALERVEPRGTIVLKSTTAEPPQVNLARVVIDEITVIGSRCGPFEPALELLASGMIAPEEMIHRYYQLEDGIAALRTAAQPGAGKILITISR